MIIWRMHTHIVKIEEKLDKVWIAGHGPDAAFEYKSLGWFVQFEGSRESLCFGKERPDLKVGDKFKITFERTEDGN